MVVRNRSPVKGINRERTKPGDSPPFNAGAVPFFSLMSREVSGKIILLKETELTLR